MAVWPRSVFLAVFQVYIVLQWRQRDVQADLRSIAINLYLSSNSQIATTIK